MACGDHPVLPEDTGISYLAEGAANIVYRICIRYPTPEPSLLDTYGDGTPPPSEIEETNGDRTPIWLQVFESE